MTSNRGSRMHIPELDGLRGLAIALVVVFHYIKCSVIGNGFWYSLSLAPLRLTWSGVQLFFVLSGFLIGGILLDTRHTNNYYRAFFGRRIHRIFPLYYLWLILFPIGRALADSSLSGMFNASVPFWSYPLYLQNVLMVIHGSMGGQWLVITWSLAVEEQFYLVLPFLINKLDELHFERFVVTAIICAPLVRTGLFLFGAPLVHILLFSCTDCLGCGVLLALLVRRNSWLDRDRPFFLRTFLVLACGIVILSLKLPGIVMVTVGYTWLALFYSNVVILAILKTSRIERWLFRSPALVWLGTVSYGIYIFHEGVRGLLFEFLKHKTAEIDDWSSVGVTALAAIATFALAEFSWRVFERPIMDYARVRYSYGASASCGSGPASVELRIQPSTLAG